MPVLWIGASGPNKMNVGDERRYKIKGLLYLLYRNTGLWVGLIIRDDSRCFGVQLQVEISTCIFHFQSVYLSIFQM